MNITYKCANRCVFCATGDRVSAALAWDKIEKSFASIASRERTARLDGGEPTMHPRLVDAIGLARELAPVDHVTTNGRLLRDRTLAEPAAEQRDQHLLISLHGATAPCTRRPRTRPGASRTRSRKSPGDGPAPAARGDGLKRQIVRANVDHSHALTRSRWRRGSQINFQFTTPFGRAWEDVVPRWRKRRTRHARDRSLCDEIDIHVINAQFCVFRVRALRRRRPAEARSTMVFAAGSALPAVGISTMVGERPRSVAVCAECP